MTEENQMLSEKTEQTADCAAKQDQSKQQGGIPVGKLWDIVAEHEGETFYTAKKLSFTYRIKGGEMFTDRRERSITRSTFEKAYLKVKENPETVRGPKALNVFGGPYVWAVLKQIGAI